MRAPWDDDAEWASALADEWDACERLLRCYPWLAEVREPAEHVEVDHE